MEEINFEEKFCKDLTEPNKIDEFLDNLKKDKKEEEYLSELQLYYPLLPPDICKKHNILKFKTEKETLFSIIEDLLKKFESKINKKQNEINKNDISELHDYINDILKKPAEDELKNIKIKIIPSRWDIIYSKIIRIDTELNDELIYYNLTNDILENIKNSKYPYEILSFLKKFISIYNKLPFKNDLQKATKKFILTGLSNCEYVDKTNQTSFLKVLNFFLNSKFNLQMCDDHINAQIINPRIVFGGKLHQSILKFAKSNLAKSSFKEIFLINEIPKEIENEIFSDNIEKYIYYFPYKSRCDTERTIKRFFLILINTNRNKKILNVKNQILDDLLSDFANIVVRKFTFGHEHQHLSGGLLFFLGRIKRIGTPPYKMFKEKLEYDYNSEEKGERGELFELKSYGKVFKTFNIFDLLFIANEEFDDLDIASHLQKYKNYCEKKKDLKTELQNFPKEQTLSELIGDIYEELLNDPQNDTIFKELSNKAIAYKKESTFPDENDYDLLSNATDIVRGEICPLSKSKPTYRNTKGQIIY